MSFYAYDAWCDENDRQQDEENDYDDALWEEEGGRYEEDDAGESIFVMYPDLARADPWTAQRACMNDKLDLLEIKGWGRTMRVKIVRQLCEYLAEPANIGLLIAHPDLREVVLEKVSVLRPAASTDNLKRLYDMLEES